VDQHNRPLTPADLLQDGRSNKSPLHDAFEWDDAVAGEAWRMRQASHLLVSLVVVDADEPPEEGRRAMVNVRGEDDTRGWIFADVANADVTYRTQLTDKARDELERWVHRWRQYEELQDLADAIERAMHRVHRAA